MKTTEPRVEFRGAIDFPTYERALRLHGGSGRGVLWAWLLLLAIATAHSVVLPLLRDQFELRATWPAIGAALLLARHALGPRIAARNAIRRGKVLLEPYRGVASAAGVEIAAELGNPALPWAKVHRARVSERIALIYPSPTVFNIVAADWFASDADWRSFQRLVREHAPRARRFDWRAYRIPIAAAAILILLFGAYAFR